ncbi:putative DUF3850 domain-containing protein [Bacillus phage vB_BceS-M2]|nr:hypothetical protein PBC5_044 [Bacillus phage PBC5]
MLTVYEIPWGNSVEWGAIFCPMLNKEVMTYYAKGGKPYDTYTNIFVNEDGDMYYYTFDQDEGGWHEEPTWVGNVNEKEEG